MLLVLCVDLDDDLGRKTGIPTPVIGADDVTEAAVALATADPEDSDVNVLFQGVNVHDELAAGGEAVEVAAVTGVDGSDVKANRAQWVRRSTACWRSYRPARKSRQSSSPTARKMSRCSR